MALTFRMIGSTVFGDFIMADSTVEALSLPESENNPVPMYLTNFIDPLLIEVYESDGHAEERW